MHRLLAMKDRGLKDARELSSANTQRDIAQGIREATETLQVRTEPSRVALWWRELRPRCAALQAKLREAASECTRKDGALREARARVQQLEERLLAAEGDESSAKALERSAEKLRAESARKVRALPCLL
jgi:hypothetical protein